MCTLYCGVYTYGVPHASPKAQKPLRRKRLLVRSHVSLMRTVNVMAIVIQLQDKKPSLSLDPRMQFVALELLTHNI